METIYILDDKISAVKSLENIVQTKKLGVLIGSNTDAIKGKAEILEKHPDIVLIDLLMPNLDGITIVRDVLAVLPDISFIVFSQVTDKDMIADAYKAGVEFYITKPNNVIECETVIRKVIEQRQLKSVLSSIRSVMDKPAEKPAPVQSPTDSRMEKIKNYLASMGMLGEAGTKDIISVMESLISEKRSYSNKTTLNEYAGKIGEDPKIVKQRIRRAIKRGLTNIASIGIEDYYISTFDECSHILFNFDSVRNEMDLLRGKSAYGGKPSIDMFFEGLEMLSER